MSNGGWKHQSVLLAESIEFLNPVASGRYIDATLGAGGHSEALLSQEGSVEILGIDRDLEAIRLSTERLAAFGKQLHLFHGVYSEMQSYCEEIGWDCVDGILMDLGVSSMQLDDDIRGFSYMTDGPLDMRMNRKDRITASELLNGYTEGELAKIFHDYGEEPGARRLAKAIVKRREERPLERTGEFLEIIQSTLGKPGSRSRRPEARCFQAVRIAVNEELDILRETLESALQLLKPGGRLVVISFHSLEDRIVKQFMRDEASEWSGQVSNAELRQAKDPRLKILNRKPIVAGDDEQYENSRSRSAKLRVAEKM
ncbi:MAG: 16S rRNA (cytosine(1402)-N(4))-methyltransferase RsmH [Lentisphaeria bacterium]|nr:16S rRNA (cytosine(1402)-N(4))-methyltransferase RsmH [Lentisphaeria bacterium]NQZ68461.1 16S rRNA (cytosine(1402)-N(4))-methyltransferase RsmH [Lentisphaeria bacterium]